MASKSAEPSTAETFDELRGQIATLRRMLLAALLVSATAVAGVLVLWIRVPDEIEAKRFVVRDSDGTNVAELSGSGGAGRLVLSEAGEPAIRLLIDDAGFVRLQMTSEGKAFDVTVSRVLAQAVISSAEGQAELRAASAETSMSLSYGTKPNTTLPAKLITGLVSPHGAFLSADNVP